MSTAAGKAIALLILWETYRRVTETRRFMRALHRLRGVDGLWTFEVVKRPLDESLRAVGK